MATPALTNVDLQHCCVFSITGIHYCGSASVRHFQVFSRNRRELLVSCGHIWSAPNDARERVRVKLPTGPDAVSAKSRRVDKGIPPRLQKFEMQDANTIQN